MHSLQAAPLGTQFKWTESTWRRHRLVPSLVLLGGSPSAVAHHPPAGTPASVGCSPCPITLWHTCGTPLTVHSVPESEAEPCSPPDPPCRQTPDPAPPRESEMNPKRNLFRAPGTWGMLEMWTAPRGVGWLARGGDAPHHPSLDRDLLLAGAPLPFLPHDYQHLPSTQSAIWEPFFSPLCQEVSWGGL